MYSGLDNCEIQCSSQFPELRSSGSCPLYLVRLYLDGSLRFCVFGAFHRYGWKLDHWHCFSLSVVCLKLFSVTEPSHSICCFSLFVTWVFWLAAAAALTQSLGGALDCHTQTEFVYCGHLNALSGFAWLIWFVFFFLPILLSHKQVDNRLQGSVDFRVSFRNHPSHYGCKTRRRGCWPHG